MSSRIKSAIKNLGITFLGLLLLHLLLLTLVVIPYPQGIEARFKARLPFIYEIRRELKETFHLSFEFVLQQFDFMHHKRALKNTDLKFLTIKISSDKLKNIYSGIPEWSKRGQRKDVTGGWENAKIYYQGREWSVEMRLTGINPNHWAHAQKSYLVKCRKDDPFFGMRKFKLLIPTDKGLVSGQLLNWLAKQLGLIAHRDDFVVVSINGITQGLYYLVEDETEEMLQYNQVPISMAGWGIDDIFLGEDDPLTTLIRERWDRFCMWANYGTDEEKVSEAWQYIDIKKFAAFEALMSLFGSAHGGIPNSRIYYNTTTGLFEPIPWDVTGSLPTTLKDESLNSHQLIQHDHLVNEFLRQPEAQEAYQKALFRLTQLNIIEKYDSLYDLIKDEFLSSPLKKPAVNHEAKELVQAQRYLLKKRLELIHKNLSENGSIIIREDIGKIEKKEFVRFQVRILSFSSIALKKLSIDIPRELERSLGSEIKFQFLVDTNGNKIPDEEDRLLTEGTFSVDKKVELIPYYKIFCDRTRDFEILPSDTTLFLTSDRLDLLRKLNIKSDIHLSFYRILTGTAIENIVLVRKKSLYHPNTFYSTSIEDYLTRWPSFFTFINQTLIWNKGNHTLSTSIIFPREVNVRIEKGTHIFLGPNVSLMVRGKLRVLGTSQEPVVISRLEHKDGTNDGPWGTVAVLEGPAAIRHMILLGGSEAILDGIYFSGQFSVYHGNALIINSSFEHAEGSDAVNIKYGYSVIKNNRFLNNKSDGIDLDWSSGRIEGNDFYENGGDAVDISGGKVRVSHNRIRGSADKGVSAGEQTRSVLFNNLIYKCKMGVAVKDSSYVGIYSNTIADNETGLAIYRKKPHFEGAVVYVSNSILDNPTDVTIDANSKINVSHSVSLKEKRFGFKNIAPQFSEEKNNVYELSAMSDHFLLEGADPKDLSRFSTQRKTGLRLGFVGSSAR